MQIGLKEQPQLETIVKSKKPSIKTSILISIIVVFIVATFIFFYSQILQKNIDVSQMNLQRISQDGEYDLLFTAYNSNKITQNSKLEIEALLSDSLEKQILGFFNLQSYDKLKSLTNVCKKIPSLYEKYKVFIDSSNDFDRYKLSYISAKIEFENAKYIESLKNITQIPNEFFSVFKKKNYGVITFKNDIYAKCILSARELYNQAKYDQSNQFAQQILNIIPNDPNAKNIIFSTTNLEEYNGDIQHIFFHPLIAFPERAFGPAPNQIGQDNYMATVYEFNQTLKQLYEKGYVLIDINMLGETKLDENGKVISIKQKKLMLPKGKKPVIMSVDDVNYYTYMKKDGQVFKLVLDEDQNVATFSITPKNQELISHENEIVPILDAFTQIHTDFSINNAKGCLALTGFEGILGYRTDSPSSATYQAELESAKAVVKRLKETGWYFASHSQGHRETAMISFYLLKNDTDRWLKEVGSIIGPTNIYIYPYGQQVPPSDPKFKYLQEKGFSMFFGVGSRSPVTYGTDYLIQLRRNIDGMALKDRRLYDLFNVPTLTDPLRPWYSEWSKNVWNKK